MDISSLNEIFKPLSPLRRMQELYRHFDESEVLVTSSFGTTSAYLLHLIQRVRPTQPIYFIDTTYHFPETLAYRDQLADQLNLNIISLRPDQHLNAYTRENKTWAHDPDLCCSVNKNDTLSPLKMRHKVWVSGVMGYQTPLREQLNIFEQNDIIKFHPVLNSTEADVRRYTSYFRLPPHPLQAKDYHSIGCVHCTQQGTGRSGRWAGKGKIECGLHAPVEKSMVA
ncbi:phosphoadenosine phosphosulfate reductase [Catalinimonas alkaloidigena]|uniref:Adenosine 5'-phosphosulfate reductase n=1 Tax=Catalinimonas alkaloidigena TaxID=1075417 RepID=A0A1G9Q179_9BACT|nr:phosphoadenylyl-sulfate reductase [Catalinimonas alkaloidigena]SDM04798.1 phosphoadenosine phosphosulfate reductase [Catalinimonas alkaloidigena]